MTDKEPARLNRESYQGERNGRAKLTVEQVIDIRNEYARGGTSHEKLGAKFGVHPATIGKIIKGQRWNTKFEQHWKAARACEAGRP